MKVLVKVTVYSVTYSFKNGTSNFFYHHHQKMSFCWDSFVHNETSMLQKIVHALFFLYMSLEMANDGWVAYKETWIETKQLELCIWQYKKLKSL
jgi:hypothetical protein